MVSKVCHCEISAKVSKISAISLVQNKVFEPYLFCQFAVWVFAVCFHSTSLKIKNEWILLIKS